MIEKCENCRFYSIEGSYCFRYPRQVFKSDGAKWFKSVYPEVTSGDRCGEFQPKPELIPNINIQPGQSDVTFCAQAESKTFDKDKLVLFLNEKIKENVKKSSDFDLVGDRKMAFGTCFAVGALESVLKFMEENFK